MGADELGATPVELHGQLHVTGTEPEGAYLSNPEQAKMQKYAGANTCTAMACTCVRACKGSELSAASAVNPHSTELCAQFSYRAQNRFVGAHGLNFAKRHPAQVGDLF